VELRFYLSDDKAPELLLLACSDKHYD
jgi:hypothetical protein